MFSKGQVFLFLASFFIVFIAVFFVWNIFTSSNNYIFIFNNFKSFTASLPAGVDVPLYSGIPSISTEQVETESSNLADEEEIQNFEMTEQEKQDLLDDIAEKIDIIRRQISDIADLAADFSSESQDLARGQDDQKPETEEVVQLAVQPTSENNFKTASTGGGSRPNYAKILISEVQVAGQNDEKEEFVELYNPNGADVDLTNWYLQRKTAGGSSYTSYAPSTLFFGKKISPNDYFLIARQGYSTGSADVFVENPITADNSFALKNPNGDISDKLGFGRASDTELLPAANPGDGQSIGRKVLPDATEKETDDNSADFEIQTSTPRARNIAYAPPPPPPFLEIDSTDSLDTVTPEETEIIIPKKVLINEVQIAPIEQRFVELFNPNPFIIDLTGWYLQRKTQSAGSWNSFVSKPNFENKIIGSNDYFLITRSGYSFSGSSDIFMDDFSLSNNNSLALENSNLKTKDKIVDKLGWGEANDFETAPASNPMTGQSIKRKEPGLDTDNNSVDFIISDTPTPRRE